MSTLPQLQDIYVGPSTATLLIIESKKRKLSIHSQRDEEKKMAKRESANERRRAREAAMSKEIEDEHRSMAVLRKTTEEIAQVVQARNLIKLFKNLKSLTAILRVKHK